MQSLGPACIFHILSFLQWQWLRLAYRTAYFSRTFHPYHNRKPTFFFFFILISLHCVPGQVNEFVTSNLKRSCGRALAFNIIDFFFCCSLFEEKFVIFLNDSLLIEVWIITSSPTLSKDADKLFTKTQKLVRGFRRRVIIDSRWRSNDASSSPILCFGKQLICILRIFERKVILHPPENVRNRIVTC